MRKVAITTYLSEEECTFKHCHLKSKHFLYQCLGIRCKKYFPYFLRINPMKYACKAEKNSTSVKIVSKSIFISFGQFHHLTQRMM